MKIIEVRDGFVKIESEKEIALSAFLHIKDTKQEYIAQVVQKQQVGSFCICYAKLIFNYCGAYHPYDKSIPEISAEIKEFTKEFINEKLLKENSLYLGNFVTEDIKLPINEENLNKKTLFVADDYKSLNPLIKNINQQVEQPLYVIDLIGNCDCNYIAGKDFKLPLNRESLAFIYEDCLNDATSDSKEMIKEVFKDLAEYANSATFIPFIVLKNIIDDLVEKSLIFKLLVLKNKLAKFNTLGYFASTIDESNAIKSIFTNTNSIINLSKLDPIFQNRYLTVLCSEIIKHNPKAKICVLASNSIDKKSLKNVLTNENLDVIFVTHSKFKYLKEIKQLFKNFIIEPSFNTNEIFKVYSIFLKAMNKDSLLYVGEDTENLPFLISNSEIFIEQKNSINEVSPKEIEQEDEQEIKPQTNENKEFAEESKQNALNEILNDEEEETVIAEFEETSTDIKTEELSSNSIEAIEKKSQVLIEQISEELNNSEESPVSELFEDESSSDTEINETTQPIENLEEIEPQEDLSLIGDESVAEDQLIDPTEEMTSLEQLSEANDNTSDSLFETETENIELTENIDEKSEIIELDSNQGQSLESEQEEDCFDEISIDNNDTEILVEDQSLNISLEDDLDDEEILMNIEQDSVMEEDDLEKSIIEDVDKVFTTIKDDSISETDLDFIDELNNDNLSLDENEEVEYASGLEEIENYDEVDVEENDEILSPIEDYQNPNTNAKTLETKENLTSNVPIYSADIPPEDMINSDYIEQGDKVTHAKYGVGIVEKMIKYGTKTLFSINFDNVGRRLLDPTLTEIRKV